MQSKLWVLINKTGKYFLLFFLLLSCACSRVEDSYFPLKKGLWWEYGATLIIRGETFTQRRIVNNLSEVSLLGVNYFTRQLQGSKIQYYRIEGDGIHRYLPVGKSSDAGLADSELILPFDTATTWSRPSRLGVIESRTFAAQDRILTRPKEIVLDYRVLSDSEDVTVPAGRFVNCLKVQGTGKTIVKVDRGNASAEVTIENTDWYAPGIGLIKTERLESSESTFLKPGRYTLELLETSGKY